MPRREAWTRKLHPGRFEAYSAGIRRWPEEVAAGRAPLPFELRWLGIEPAPWSAADTLAIVRMRAWLLGRSLGASLLLERLKQELGGIDSQDFFPGDPPSDEAAGPRPLDRLIALSRVADAWANRHSVGQTRDSR